MLNNPSSNIRLFISIIFAMLCWCIPAAAQEGTCSLKFDQLKEAPELFGLHLSMTLDQVKGHSALLKFGPPDKFGVVRTSSNQHSEPGFNKTEFAGVRTISLDFLDGKLVSLWVGYEETYKWPKLANFIANFSKSLNVPPDWPAKRNGRELTCDGFSLFGSIIAGGPALRIADEIAQNMIAERREKAAEEAEAEVVGDTRTLQYYPSDCSAKDDVPSTSRTIFKNKVEAESAGYKLAKVCQ